MRGAHYILLALVGVILGLTACKDDEPTPAVDLGYEYFPMEVGRYVSYKVDSIGFDEAIGDTFRFEIKERIDSLYTESDGSLSARLERYYRETEADAWQLRDIWIMSRSSSRAEKYEENVRFVRMAFAVNEEEVWDGNAFNIYPEWTHRYTDIGSGFDNSWLSFDETVRVIQRADSNLTRSETAEEVYAKEVGMIYKRLDTFNTVFPSFSIPERGVKFEMRAYDFGLE